MLKLEDAVPLAAFLTVALGTWGVLSLLAGSGGQGEDRLKRLIDRSRRGGVRPEVRLMRQQERLQDRVARTASRLAAPVRPKDEAGAGKVRELLLNAGYRHPQAVQAYLGLKMVGLLLGLAVAAPVVVSKMGATPKGLMYIAGGGCVGFYLPALVVGGMKKKRQEAIFLGLPDALDLMVVCVEAGLGFDGAMRRVTTELVDTCPVLCEELNLANFQVQMGRPRREALKELGVRTGVDDVRALAAVIIQAERFGSSIGTALRVQSDAMRTKRRQLAEERAAKTAVKIMLPLIMFIFPGVFVILVGPAGLKIAETLLK